MRRLFVISDLHLGGRPDSPPGGPSGPPGTRLCRAYGPLVEFIDWVRAQPEGKAQVELVINGDIVDFLAEDDYPNGLSAEVFTADEGQVLQKLEHIAARTRVHPGASDQPRGVFEALSDLLAAGRRLTLLLGNHDVELALPRARAWLEERLGGPEGLRLIHDGEAYCVGRALIEHGNRYDRWNQIDHSGLRQERSIRSRRLVVEERLRGQLYFLPPAGTHLVIHFMNRIKNRYRFVDMLKPETAAVVPLLVALEPDYWPEIDDIVRAVPIGKAYGEHGMVEAALPRRPGDLSDDSAEPGLAAALTEALGPDAQLFPAPPLPPTAGNLADDGDGFLYQAHRWIRTRLEDLAQKSRSLLALGKLHIARDDEARWRQLHAAFRVLGRGNHAFDVGSEEETYHAAARRAAREGGFQCVVYGHTHLPKKIVDPAGWTYLNTGTWADVLRLPPMTEDFDHDADTVRGLADSMAANDLAPYVQRYLTFAEIEVDDEDHVTLAEIHSYCGKGKERCAPLTAHPGSEGESP